MQQGNNAIAEYAKSKRYRAGIHLDGFKADKTSRLYIEHPDWFLKNQIGETICKVSEKNTCIQYVYFDYLNPVVCEYIKNVLTAIRAE